MPEAKKAMYDLISAHGGNQSADGMVKRALKAIRSHLGMEVAYVSEFVGDRAVFREVDAPGLEHVIKPGDSQSLEDIFCRHILDGRLPEIIPDTSAEPLAMSLPIMKKVPIGKHLSVPIRMPDGKPFGMFCCLGFAPDHSLRKRDLNMMKVFADLAAFEIQRDLVATNESEERRERIRQAIEGDILTMVYQPIWNIETSRPIGIESLSRFSGTPSRTPDLWFKEAEEAGLGAKLELAAIRKALAALPDFPQNIYMSVNASPETILSDDIESAMDGVDLDRIVLEITEHARVESYARLNMALAPLRERGLRVAIDDAGAGYASLQHILQLRPDIIKLDMGLTRSIDLDPARRALAMALIGFAYQLNATIVAEGVETESELKTLRAIGIEAAQGYLLGRPVPRAEAAALLARKESVALVA